MKKKRVDTQEKVNGYYIRDVETGFWGDQGEGEFLLSYMGLNQNRIPFSTAQFLQNRRICWKDSDGNVATMSFKVKEDQIEFYGFYLGKKKSARMFREWGEYEDPEMVIRMESEAIGNLCMMCIFEKIAN